MRDCETDLVKRLDIIIRLLAMPILAEMKTGERVLLLARAGLDRATIAELAGTTPETVSVRLAEARRKHRSTTAPAGEPEESRG